MKTLNTPDQFNSRTSLLFMGVIGLFLAYLLILRAFDTGSYWQYLGTLILLVLGIKLIIRGIKSKS